MYVCMYICMYVFASDHKNINIYIYASFLKAVLINNICDVKYITIYTNLVYHMISDGGDSLKSS